MLPCMPGAHEGFDKRFDDSTMIGDIGVRRHTSIVHSSPYLVVQGWWLEELGVNVRWNPKL